MKVTNLDDVKYLTKSILNVLMKIINLNIECLMNVTDRSEKSSKLSILLNNTDDNFNLSNRQYVSKSLTQPLKLHRYQSRVIGERLKIFERARDFSSRLMAEGNAIVCKMSLGHPETTHIRLTDKKG